MLVQTFHEYSKIIHLGKKKLLSQINLSFYVQSFKATYDKMISECVFCKLHSGVLAPKAPLGMTIDLQSPAQMFCIDYIVINSSYKTYPAILTLTDPFSGYCHFLPANDSWNDTRMIEALLSAFSLVGFPVAIGSDNQASLISSKVQCWARVLNIKLFKTQCQDEFRNLSGCVIKILTAGRILQISISWCQIEAEIRSFPTMYGKGGGRCGKNWRNQGFRPKVMPKTRLF